MNPTRQPPTNTQAEQQLLGALLIDNRAYGEVSDWLAPAHFATAVYARIYEAIAASIERGDQANPVTLFAQFDRDDALKTIGGGKHLAHLAAGAVTVTNTRDYARVIVDLARRRALINACESAIERAHTAEAASPADDLLAEHGTALEQIGGEPGIGQGAAILIGEAGRRAIDRTEKAYQAGGEITGLPTGLDDLDHKLNGLQPGDFVVIGGRPGQGKTALAINIACFVARKGVPVLLLELEQSAEQLAQRQLAALSGVSSMRQRRGNLDAVHWERLVEGGRELDQLPVYIDDTPGLGIAQVRQRARRAKRRHKIGLLMLDHLHLMHGGETGGRRLDELAQITAGFKGLAKELAIPVVVLAQLSRALEQRDDKRPLLVDLREAGTIEQDADVVIFLYREEYYLAREEPRQKPGESADKFNARLDTWHRACDEAHGIAELIVAKQREGPIGTVKVHWDPEAMTFSSLARAI